MKWLCMLTVLVLAMAKKTHHRNKQVENNNLPPTPKGPGGLKKQKTISLKSDDPNKVKLFTVDYKGNYILQELEKKAMNRVTRFCNRVDNEHDAFCAKIKECDICTMSYKCGWCESTNQCVSGNVAGAYCPEDCLQNWAFHTTQCKMTVKAGKLGNWAPDAEKLINAEQVDNTGSVRVNYLEPQYFVRESQVQIGSSKNKNVDHKVNIKFDGQNAREEKISVTPLYGKQVMRVPLLNKKLSSKLINISTGEEIPPIQKIEPKVFHGLNDGGEHSLHGSRL